MEFVLAIVIITLTMFLLYNKCYFCKNWLSASDRMANGRVRYRASGTNMPVCRCCAKYRRDEVE